MDGYSVNEGGETVSAHESGETAWFSVCSADGDGDWRDWFSGCSYDEGKETGSQAVQLMRV